MLFRSPEHNRILKVLSLALPGKLFVSQPGAELSRLRRGELFTSKIVRAIEATGPICVVGSASEESIERILPAVRERFPGIDIQGVFITSGDQVVHNGFDRVISTRSALFAYLKLLPNIVGKGRYRRIVLPLTDEGFTALKVCIGLLPFIRIEAYNEHLDSFSLRNVISFARHLVWRYSEDRTKKKIAATLHFQSLPVAVVGSASAYYLKKIVPVVRERFPNLPIHGYLPESVAGPARGLFDSVTILPSNAFPLFWKSIWLSRKKVQSLVVPLTDEKYFWYQLAAFVFLHAGPKQIFNEVADGFRLSDVSMVFRHFRWRLKDSLVYQIVAGTAGKNPLVRAFHLIFYPCRLIRGSILLAKVELASKLRSFSAKKSSANEDASVAVICLDTANRDGETELPVFGKNSARIQLATTVGNSESFHELVQQVDIAIRGSQATFVCLFDSKCQVQGEGWLDRILAAFDTNTAQVGPAIADSLRGRTNRGALLSGTKDLNWVGADDVCYIQKPEYLKVDALPWNCVVIRRSAYISVGGFGNTCSNKWPLIERDFCQKLAAGGWVSVCHNDVVASLKSSTTTEEQESARYGSSMALLGEI